MYREKAKFTKRPEDVTDTRMNKLYNIRQYRRIDKEDMENIWPSWNKKYD